MAPRLRILIYGLNYAPELTGIGKYTGEMAAWLAARGHRVHVVTAPPYYPAWHIGQGYRNTWKTESGNPTVYRTPLYVPEKPSGAKRLIHLASFAVASVPWLFRQIFFKPQIVFTIEPTFFGAPFALLAAHATGAASWLHVQDFEVDAAFELGLLPARGPVHTIALRLEQFFTDAFTRVSSISTKMVERSIAKGVPPTRTVLFPNWVDIDAIHPLPGGTLNPFRRGREDKILLLYSGNMGNKQGLELLAPLARHFAPDPRVHFLFCGDGSFRPQLESAVHGLENVTLLPLQPFDQLNNLLNAADLHLLPQRAGAADLVMPSKLTGMLSSGRPVVATADPGTQVAHVVAGAEEPCGLVVPAEDPEALYAAVRRLIDSPELRATLGASARRYAVQYLGRDQVLARFEQDLITLVSPGVPPAQVN